MNYGATIPSPLSSISQPTVKWLLNDKPSYDFLELRLNNQLYDKRHEM